MMQNNTNVSTYFLQQGQSISKVYDILNSSILTGYIKRGFSIVVEVLLGGLFFLLIFCSAIIPLDPIQFTKELSDDTLATATIHNEDLMAVMIGVKIFVFVVSLFPLVLLFLLRRNRKKGELIHVAFTEVEVMKKRFDEALKNLNI